MIAPSAAGIIEAVFEISKGDVPAHTFEYKFGQNPAIGAAYETVWDQGGIYAYLSSATVLKVSSSSTDDDVGGTGALTVQLYGLDANYEFIGETITLTGRTAINTTNSYLRIYRIVVRSAGSGGKNAGDIYAGTGIVTTGVPAVKYAKIVIGNNQTLMCVYTIPAGKIGLLIEIHASMDKAKDATLKLLARPVDEVFQIKDIIGLFEDISDREYHPPLKYAAKTDLELQAISTGADTAVQAGFNLILVEKA